MSIVLGDHYVVVSPVIQDLGQVSEWYLILGQKFKISVFSTEGLCDCEETTKIDIFHRKQKSVDPYSVLVRGSSGFP